MPLPLDERAFFRWEVPIGECPIVGRNNPRVPVTAVETCCEYLYVHDGVGCEGYTVSHTLTGYALIRGIPTIRIAQYVAGALKPLFRWSEDHAPYYKAHRKELDPKLWDWIERWSSKGAA